jgi:DNA-binding MarR family transcriptional regulator
VTPLVRRDTLRATGRAAGVGLMSQALDVFGRESAMDVVRDFLQTVPTGPSALLVFQYPGPRGERPSDLAARLRITKQALNYLLRELERVDYLERRPDPEDLRSKRIALTARGKAAIKVIREAVAETETLWAEQLGPKALLHNSRTCYTTSTTSPDAFRVLQRLGGELHGAVERSDRGPKERRPPCGGLRG